MKKINNYRVSDIRFLSFTLRNFLNIFVLLFIVHSLHGQKLRRISTNRTTVTEKTKKVFHLSFDKTENNLRIGIGSLLTSNKYYPELNIAFNDDWFGLGCSFGKILSKKIFNNSKNFGWYYNISLFTKINLNDSKIFVIRPGFSAGEHYLTVIDRNNPIRYSILSPFIEFDIVPLKNFGINYRAQFPVFAKSSNSKSEINHSTILHTIRLIYVIVDL